MVFRYRFPLTSPNVVTTIGATSNVAHLIELLEADRDFAPQPAEVFARIETLHRKWFVSKDI